jgi:K+-sensing histidine kinase KdpD
VTDGPSRTPGRLLRRRPEDGLERALTFEVGPFAALLIGLAVAWGAIFLKAMLNELIDGSTGYILLMAGVVLAAWMGGFVGGLTATAAAVILNAIIFGVPGGTPDADRLNLLRQLLFIVVGGGVAVLVASRRSARDDLVDALEEVAALATELEARDARLEIMLAASGTGFWEWDVQTGS